MKPLLKSNKKGTIIEVFFILFVMFVIAMVFIVGKTIYNNLNTEFATALPDQGASIMSKAGSIFPVLDGMFLFIFVGLFCGAAILAYKMDFPQVFWIFAVILGAIAVIVAGIFSNSYSEMAADSKLSAAAGSFTITDFFMDHIILLIVVITFVIIIVMFAKMQGGGE